MRKMLASGLLLTSLGLLLTPNVAPSQATCDNTTALQLMGSNYVDSALNPPTGEDTEFYTISGSVPNVMLVVDTSGSMQRLPPDGPSSLGNGGGDVPAGYSLGTNWTNSTNQNNAFGSNRIVGCSLDPTFASTADVGTNPMIADIVARRYYSPCGKAVDQTAISAAYRGHSTETGGVDYAAQASVCPHYTSSDPLKTGDAGFDPDYYPAGIVTGTETTTGTNPVFFARDLVYHDSAYFEGAYAYNSSLKFQHNFGKGWTDSATYPARSASNTLATIDTFCDQQGTKAQGSSTRAAICKTCLKKAGWYYDGVILQDQEGTHPSIWYTGNYLNFFPPKFVSAKKIVKDVIAAQTRVRLALGHFQYDSYNAANSGLTLDKPIYPACSVTDGTFDTATAGQFVSAVNGLAFSGGTPLANAIYDAGQYFHSPGLTWFGGSGKSSLVSGNTKDTWSVCYECQSSSVVLITDGVPSGSDGDSLPGAETKSTDLGKYAGDTNTGIRGITKTTCPQCDAFTDGTSNAYKDNLAKVAWYMHHMDLRSDSEDTRDCAKNGGKQVLDLYTVGFATNKLPEAEKILRNAAIAGGDPDGSNFISADNTETLRTGLSSILDRINGRSTSFSVATVSTLQTTSGRSVIVPRFEPSTSAHFRGHLLALDLYSEFVNACDPKSDGTGTGDYDCDGTCTSVFLKDKSGSFVLEDSLGNFVKTSGSTPACTQATKCSTTSGKTCSNVSSTPAEPHWDAGEQLKGTDTSQQWKTRIIWTVVDDSGDGKIDASDAVTQLQANATVANLIAPYLGLGGGTVCNAISSRLNGAGNTARALEVTSSQVECAKTIIRYVLGADVFNEQAVDTDVTVTPHYPQANEDDLWDRPWILGDIFHSSPVVVQAPFPRTGIICPNGLANQCLESLWATPTPNGNSGYDGYATSDTYKNRRQISLVGANDGLVHAFNAGEWHGNTTGVHKDDADDATTTGIDESLPPFNGYYDRGDGKELWAFLPPDMLSKIPLYVTSSTHQFFVDGTPMVRDVWVDGTENSLGTASASDDRKDKQEFHTVAVFGERRGGTHFFALDVTDATAATVAAKPQFLWIYPQPNSSQSLDFGETYGDFLPRPPPIGPVRIEASSSDTHAPNTPDYKGTKYHERWVVFLNGGFDPQYVRGRGVHMVDVWTGKELWDFSYSSTTTDVRNALRFPVAATVGMTGWGENVQRTSNETNDFFFDTATFGDTGGQLWALRFHVPGTLDNSGHVTNWTGARIFQMGTQSQSCMFCGGQPFFYMTANVPLPASGYYRVFAGSGDRYNLLDTMGGTCGPDNIRACVLRGCTVTLEEANNSLATYNVGSAARGLSETACGAMTNTQTDGTFSTCSAEGKVKITISSCPSPVPSTAAAGTVKNATASCTWTSTGYQCTAPGSNKFGSKLTLSNTSNNIKLGNLFYSLLVFDGNKRPLFGTTGDATALATDRASYDSNRIWLNETGLDASKTFTGTYTDGLALLKADDDNPAQASLASDTSSGWVIYYNHEPTATADGHLYNVYWADERTSSGTGQLPGGYDIYWNTIQPATGEVISTNGTCDPSKCGQIEARRVARKYGANVTTGGLPGGLTNASGVPVRSNAAALLVPTQADQATVFVNQKGQIAVGLTAVNPERGASNVGQTAAQDPTQDYGTFEVNTHLHDCRHATSSSAASCN